MSRFLRFVGSESFGMIASSSIHDTFSPPGVFFPMNKLISLLTIGAIFGCISPSMAQQHKRISPHETVSKVIDGNRVMVVYGRPYTKDPKSGQNRKIWGELVPYGEVWRTGADEATLLITQKPIVMGSPRFRPALTPCGLCQMKTAPPN